MTSSQYDENPDNRTFTIQLALVISCFIVVFSFLSYLRFADFFTTNWDFGIFQQMFWSTSHGMLLYESGDFTSYGVRSFLEVHSGYVAILFSFVYHIYPKPITIFVMQTTFVGLTIIPLSRIMQNFGLDSRKSVLFTIPVLLNFTVISATFYDFHLESLIPLEFLTLFYFATKKKYALVIITFLVGCFTLEVFPFLCAGIGIYIGIERWMRNRQFTVRDRVRSSIFPLLMLAGSVVVYAIIRFAQYKIIPALLGDQVTMAIQSNTLSNAFLSLVRITSTPYSIAISSAYWLLLLASLGFIPLLKPRYLVLAVPWLLASILLFPQFSSRFGNQYAFVAISPLLVGYAHGIADISRKNSAFPAKKILILISCLAPLTATFLVPGMTRAILGYENLEMLILYLLISSGAMLVLVGPVRLFITSRKKKWSFKKHALVMPADTRKMGLIVLLIILLVFNLNLSPLNTNNFAATPYPGYQFQYKWSNLSGTAVEMSGLIPYNSTVVASDNLFPYVANRLTSYSLLWYPPGNGSTMQFFPFNSSHLPQYLFLSMTELPCVPGFLIDALQDTSSYGLICYALSNESTGNLLLFELGYNGSPVKLN